MDKWQIISLLSRENSFLIEQMLDFFGVINTVQLTYEQAAQFYIKHCSSGEI